MSVQNISSTVFSDSIENTGTESCSPHFKLSVIHELRQTVEAVISQNSSLPETNSKNIGSRPLSETRQIQLTQTRKLESSQAPEKLAAFFPPVYLFSDPRIHFIDSYSLYDFTIQLEDGSSWSVYYPDMYKVQGWASNDELSISPYGFFGNDYRITNHTTGDSVVANLVLEPIPFGRYSHWIVAIDDILGRVYLEDGSFWEVRSADRFLLAEWDVYDTVILGDGRDDWFGWNDSILINVDMNHYVYANKGV